MGQQGLFRYGSTWVTPQQLQALDSNQQNMRTALARLEAASQSAGDGSNLNDQIQKVSDDYAATQASVDYLTSTMNYNGADASVGARRDAMLADLQKLGEKRSQLEAQRAATNANAPYVPAEREKLKAALAAAQHIKFSGIQRIMELGEDENPPAPAMIAMPVPYVPPPPTVIVQQTVIPPPPVVEPFNPYAQFGTLGVAPVIPIARPQHLHDHGDGNNPSPISTTPIFPVTYPISPIQPTTQPR